MSPALAADDLSVPMVAGLHRYLDAQLPRVVAERERHWSPDFSSRAAYEKSVAPNRARLAAMLGVVDARVTPAALDLAGTVGHGALVAETDRLTIHAVRWPALAGVHGEGLLLRPKGRVLARIVALPDADQTPELVCGLAPGLPPARQFARRLAETGCEVLVPVLIDRATTLSRNDAIGRRTLQPHREFIYRQSFAHGRHPLGFEIQIVLAALDAWGATEKRPLAVAGYGEGGLIALLAAALDPRIEAAAVSGHFGPRESLHLEPIYRNVFGLLREFGDADLARLVVPRTLIVEAARGPEFITPALPGAAINPASPGRLATPPRAEVEREIALAKKLAGPWPGSIRLTAPGADFFSDDTLREFLRSLDPSAPALAAAGAAPRDARANFDPAPRQHRLVRALGEFCQRLIVPANTVREAFLWNKVPPATPDAWREAMRPYREKFHAETLGRLPRADPAPLNIRSRPLPERAAFTVQEITLDVRPDIVASGWLLLPKNFRPGERRPVVVAQHGLEGQPADLLEEDKSLRAWTAYKAYAARLAERGFIVFAPQNPYRGAHDFRSLQRKAHPLGLSLYSFIVAQHERIVDWLAARPDVDPARIAFYGLSYGGTTALRVPAVDERYCAVICSGNFNEWVWKLTTTEWRGSYVFTQEYEMPEWNLGPTFGHAEMAALIAPRPFMVERGHADGVGIDEWVAFEYAKVNRLYARLKLPERTAIEYFDGGHTINGLGSYAFLHRHLAWPAP